MQKSTKKKIPPIIVVILVVLFIGPMVAAAAYVAGMAASAGIGAILPFLLLYVLVGGAIIIGIVYAMTQRLREIDGGEEDEASKY